MFLNVFNWLWVQMLWINGKFDQFFHKLKNYILVSDVHFWFPQFCALVEMKTRVSCELQTLCIHGILPHVSEIWIITRIYFILQKIQRAKSVSDVLSEKFTRVRPTPWNVRPTPTYFDDLHNFQNRLLHNAGIRYKAESFIQWKLVLVFL